jgi:Tol biopolymer transport system component
MSLKEHVMAEENLVPLIPRKVLFGEPEILNPQISPDGKHIAYLAPKDEVLNIWVRTVGNGDKPVTNEKRRGIRKYFWAEDGEHLIYLQDFDGDENWHIYSVNLHTDEVRDLTPFPGIRADVVATSPNFPDETAHCLEPER